MIGLSRLSMNQATVSQLNLTQTIQLCLEQEIPSVGLWRHRVAELGISEVTIKLHRGQVMRKMKAGSLADLVRLAEKLGG